MKGKEANATPQRFIEVCKQCANQRVVFSSDNILDAIRDAGYGLPYTDSECWETLAGIVSEACGQEKEGEE